MESIMTLNTLAEMHTTREGYEKAIRQSIEKHGDDATGRFLKDLADREPSEIRDRAIRYGMEALIKTEKEAGL